MKKIFSIAVIIAIILAGVLGWAYFAHPSREGGISVSVLVDKTDTLLSIPDVEDISSVFQVEENKWKDMRFSIQTLSDVDYNPVLQEALPGGNQAFSNPYTRKAERDSFLAKARAHISEINKMPYGLPRSNIYIPLIRELNRLTTIDGKKIAILYSNCQENSSVFSAYTQSNLILNNPDSVKKLLLKATTPGNLHGVRVYIVFRPTHTDNEKFVRMAAIFKELLEEAGAEVHVGANLVIEKT